MKYVIVKKLVDFCVEESPVVVKDALCFPAKIEVGNKTIDVYVPAAEFLQIKGEL